MNLLRRKKTDALVDKAIPWLKEHTGNSDQKRQGQRCVAKAGNNLEQLSRGWESLTADLDTQRNSELRVLVSSNQSAQTDKQASRPAMYTLKWGSRKLFLGHPVTRVRGSHWRGCR